MTASPRPPVVALATRLIATQLLPRLDHAIAASRQPFRYCNLMTMIGACSPATAPASPWHSCPADRFNVVIWQ